MTGAVLGAVLGDVRVDVLDAGTLRLDGGAMFRTVPRPLWERRAAPDARNRVLLGMRPLLVRTPRHVVLVDAGSGPERRDATFRERLALEPGLGLEAALRAAGAAPEDVDVVVLSHLHFDHGGGLVGPGGDLRFPRARVVVQRRELEDSTAGCELCKGSYVEGDHEALAAAGRLDLVDGDVEVVPGVRALVTGGHTRAHQVVLVEGGGRTLVAWGDLVPTAAHLRPHYVMAFDLYPVQSYEAKRALVPRAVEEGWLHVLYHEPGPPLGLVRPDGRDYRLEPVG